MKFGRSAWVKTAVAMSACWALAACGSDKEPQEDQAAPASEETAPLAADVAAPAQPQAPAAPEAAPPPAPAPAPEMAKPDEPPVAAGNASGPPQGFLICSSCHAIEPGKNGIGPSLAGVFGRKAASAPGFNYSDALKKTDITWNDATLDKWLQAPMKMVPGTRMVFGGITDAGQRKQLVAYLKSL